ncbi:MAG: hypothetical protein RLZZ245_3650 [Verrucomicrobiota bacterium]
MESVREKLKKQEIYWRSKDFSKYTTEELFDFIPSGSTSISSRLARDELKNRPDEVRVMLEKILKLPGHTFDTLIQLPFLAGIVGTDYQVEVAKRCLFHEAMKQGDMSLRIQEDVEGYGIFSLIAQSKHDETAVLDRLIEEGRLERGSEFEMKWRKLLSVGNRREKNRAEKNDSQDARNGDRKTEGIPMGKADSESLSDSNYLVLGGVIALLGILALLVKFWMGRSTR